MHEMGLAMEILRACRQAAAGRRVGRLEEVQVDVGELTAVEPELLTYAWQAVVAGAPEQGSTLSILWHPARQICAACGEIEERAPGSWLRLCPGCREPLQVTGGDDLTVRSCRFLPAGAAAG